MKLKQHTLINRGSSILTLIAFVLVMGFTSCSSSSDDNVNPTNNTVPYSGTFVKSNASVTTSATGTVSGTFDPSKNELTYTVSWNNLTSTVGDMHFHDNGPIIVHIEGFPTTATGTFSGKAMFTADQANDLAAGRIYLQIHTVNFPGGEVIATLAKTGSNPNPNPNPGY